jgi:hypothetical protein
MKNLFKASLLTVMMSAGICFSSQSSCAYDPSIDCMFCAFNLVDRGACAGTGSSCPPQIICGGMPQQ